jgi:small acid-soluble spore protein A (major alpha-type SASP)
MLCIRKRQDSTTRGDQPSLESIPGLRNEKHLADGRSISGKNTRWEESIMANNGGNSNNLLVPQANQALDQLKYEIAAEFGVNLGADTTSRQNGSVGGEITKRLVSFAEQQLSR